MRAERENGYQRKCVSDIARIGKCVCGRVCVLVVWPDVRIKVVAQFSPKVAQKEATAVFT